MELLCDSLSPPPPPSSSADMRSDSERALRMSHRKFNKHMAEKRRRARINQALEEMKNMVLSGMQKDPEHYDKMEKADILDLTVKYVTTVVAESPDLSAALTGKKFRVGYEECLKEVDTFLNTVAIETSAKSRLVGHLSTQAHTQSASHVLARFEGERLAAFEDARRREAAAASSTSSGARHAAPTAVVAPVHVAAPQPHSAASAGSAENFHRQCLDLDARLKPHHPQHPHRHAAGSQHFDVACLPLPAHLPPPPPPHHLLPHAASHPNMAHPVPVDLRHKYFQVADRCIPVPLYDSMWRPWDRPVSV